jgi:hypothetical protein
LKDDHVLYGSDPGPVPWEHECLSMRPWNASCHISEDSRPAVRLSRVHVICIPSPLCHLLRLIILSQASTISESDKQSIRIKRKRTSNFEKALKAYGTPFYPGIECPNELEYRELARRKGFVCQHQLHVLPQFLLGNSTLRLCLMGLDFEEHV